MRPGRGSHAMFQVVACSRCRRARIVEQGRKQATCGGCNRTLTLRDLRAFATTPSIAEAQSAVAVVNARLAGRERELAAAFVPEAPRARRHEDRFAEAAAAARRFSAEKDRADAIARALGSFAEDDLVRAFHIAGIPAAKAAAHLARMLATDIVFEPRAGAYRAM